MVYVIDCSRNRYGQVTVVEYFVRAHWSMTAVCGARGPMYRHEDHTCTASLVYASKVVVSMPNYFFDDIFSRFGD